MKERDNLERWARKHWKPYRKWFASETPEIDDAPAQEWMKKEWSARQEYLNWRELSQKINNND